MPSSPALDPITTEVIGHHLLAVAEEAGIALKQSAYSTNVKERADCSTAIFTAVGETAAQASHQPIHLGSMLFLIAEITERYSKDEIRPGDVFMANDPYAGGGSHLMDISVAAPVFHDGKLIAWVATLAHHSDVGGRVPGSQAVDNVDVFQEGLRIPALRVVDEGRMNDAVIAIVLQNSRLPDERMGDLRAQFAACALAREKVVALAERYGRDLFETTLQSLLDENEAAFRAAVGELPSGAGEFESSLDDDGVGDEPVTIRVKVSVEETGVEVDFAGTDPQTRGARNLVPAGLHATCYYALRAAIAPNISSAGGYHRAIRILAPPGTVVNAHEPAASGSRIQTAQRIVDAMLGALAEIVPARVQASSHGGATIVVSGTDPASGRRYAHYEAIGGGGGATADADGWDGVQTHMTNTGNVPIEVFELEFPLMIERYELRSGSGGLGRTRGGLGVRRDIRVLRGDVSVNAMGDRHRAGADGLEGGGSGGVGGFSAIRSGDEVDLHGRAAGLELETGDMLRIETSGGGGFGPPGERDPRALENDRCDEKN